MQESGKLSDLASSVSLRTWSTVRDMKYTSKSLSFGIGYDTFHKGRI